MRRCVFTCAAVSVLVPLAALPGCRKDPAPDGPAHPLVGDWVRIYPTAGALDTLTLAADRSVRGSLAGLDSADFRLAKWQIGAEVMPQGLCMGDGERLWCQGFRLRNHTLVLGNLKGTVFVRLPKDGRHVTITPLARPLPDAAARPPVAGMRPAPSQSP